MSVVPSAFTPPDGGYGWVIVFSSFFIHFMCNGLTLAMGVLCVSWYQEFNSSKTETSWVVSATFAVMLAMGPFASSLAARIGYRAMAMTGACFITVGSLLSSMAGSIHVLMLTLSVIGGIGAGMCYLPAVAVPAFYFEKRRSLAMGLGTAGIGGGMFLLAPVINWLIQYYGWRGTMLVLAGFSFNLCVAGALMRPLDAIRMPIEQSILVKYPNSEATSDTESLVQSYREDDPMRELKMKLGRITLESNSDSDLTSDKSSQEMANKKRDTKSSDHEEISPKNVEGRSPNGSHTLDSEPILPTTAGVTPCDIERVSPKQQIPAIVIDPFPAIDMPTFEGEKGKRKTPTGSDDLPNTFPQENKISNIKNSQNVIGDFSDAKGQSNLMLTKMHPENVQLNTDDSVICSCNTNSYKDDNAESSQVDSNTPFLCHESPDMLPNSELKKHSFDGNNGLKARNEKDFKNDANKLLGTNSGDNLVNKPFSNNILEQNELKNKENDKTTEKSSHLEQVLKVMSGSTPSFQTNSDPCCNCDNIQRSQKYIPTNSTPNHRNSVENKDQQPVLKTKIYNQIFEPSQNHHNSFPGNAAKHSIPNSSKNGEARIFANEDNVNNNHLKLNGGVLNSNQMLNTNKKISMAVPSTTVAQVFAANHLPDTSSSLHSSMASVDAKPNLGPNILLNDTPMGGSMTVLMSEAAFSFTAQTDVEACKQFRSLLGLDLGNVYQKPCQKSSSSFLKPKDVKGTGSILTLMTLDRSLSQSKRALSRGSYEYFRSRQTIYGSYRDSFRSRNGSFVRGKGPPRVPVSTQICEAILGQLRLLQDTTFLLFALSNFFANLSIVMPAVFMVDRAVSLGLGNDFASLLVSLNGAGTIGGRVAIAAIADHPRMNRLIAYMTVLVLAGALTCMSPICGTSMLLHGIYACGFGILIGNYGALCPCVMVDLKGLDAVGESYGMLLMFMGMSNLLGAPLGGFFYDIWGSFSPPFVLHGLFLIASGAIILPLLCKRNKT